MPLTGQDFDRIIDLKSDNAYSGYFDNAKKNRIIAEATNKAIDLKIATNDRIQTESDLFGIYKSNIIYTPITNTISLILGGAGIADYFRMMNLKAQFIVPLTGNYISEALNSTPIRITLNKKSNLRSKENVIVSGVTVNTNANGTRYVKMVNPSKYSLYSDVNLLNPIASNGLYTGTVGTISRVVYNSAKDMHSNRKFSKLNEPTVHNPKFEIANGLVKVYPLTWVCSEVTVDYISTPTYVDVDEGTIDLLQTYSSRFIYFLADEVVKLFGEQSRDDGEIINANMEISQP